MLQKFKTLFGLIIILFVFAGCHHYYKATTRNLKDNPDSTLDSLKNQNRYFVLRTGSEAYYIKNMVLSADRKMLDCTLDSLPPEHQLHLVKGRNARMRYTPADIPVLTEVHLYATQDKPASVGSYILALDRIQKIEVIEKDRKRTTNSYVIGALGYTLGAFTVAGIIIAATKSSCPFVSAYDGNEFALQGEIFGGAIYPQLVRHDYLPLKMSAASNGNLQLKISNELQERQYTDMAELMVIKHNRQVVISPDADGNLYSIRSPQAPLSATLCDKKDVRYLLSVADKRLLYFDDSSSTNGNNYLVLQFNKPEAVKKGKLVLSLKNSYWLDFLYGELAKGFGNYYNTYAAHQRKKPASELLKWVVEQQIPLEISVKTNEGWQKITDIITVGPLANRDMVIPVDLSSVKSPIVEIKLSSGYLFWEIDYAAIDFTPDEKLDIQYLQPYVAVDQSGKNVLDLVAKEDNKYLEQPVPGTVATMEYKWQPTKTNEEAYTFVLHTKGYYEHIRNFKGRPDKKFLAGFKKPGAFPQFSLQRFKQFNKEHIENLAKNN